MATTAPSKQPVVYIVRHGLATLSLTGYGDDVLTAEILPQGKVAVENAAEFLAEQQLTQLWVSPLKRCQQTAQVISEKTGLSVVADPLLTEYVDGLNESWEDFLVRMTTLTEKIRQQHLGEKLCVCTHGAVMAALSHLLTDRTFTRFDLNDFSSPAGIRIITENTLTQKIFQLPC